jgi:hypothetical protein
MGGAFVMAWLVGEGIIIYRSVKVQKCPPGPGQLLLTSGVFVLLGLLAEAPSARPLAVTLAWGFDIAAFMNLVPSPDNAQQAFFNAAGIAVKSKDKVPGPWPPSKAPDTVIFPTGQ